MADRRMLHRKASVSTDLDDLRRKHGYAAALFYVLLIPNLDRWGCCPASPTKLRAMVCPLWDDVTTREVDAWIRWMIRRGMLERVEARDGTRGLRAPKFHAHQRHSQMDREAPSPWEPAVITKRWTRGKRADREKPANSRGVSDGSATGPPKGREKTLPSAHAPAHTREAGAVPPPSPDGGGAAASPERLTREQIKAALNAGREA